jgi:hypothetical protein
MSARDPDEQQSFRRAANRYYWFEFLAKLAQTGV